RPNPSRRHSRRAIDSTRSMGARSRILLAVVAFALSVPRVAQAQAEAERAEQLYTEAKKLAAEGHFSEACPMFEESQRLEPAIGTQFNLADCYDHTARPATALALFREVSRVARMSGKHERQRAADERIVVLER